ncbi:MAG: hypothetical protein AB1592_13255 [Pseudomonadota bacterium]
MGALIIYQPAGPGPGSIAKLVWEGSQGILAATRAGRRDLAARIGVWLANTREDPRCTPAMARVINSALSIALARFGGAAPDFAPLQPDDGEAA